MRKIVAYLTLLLAFALVPNIAHVQDKSKWQNTTPDLTYIAKLPSDTLLIVVREDSSIKTLGALIDLAKKSGPGRIRLAAGAGDGPVARKFMQSIGAPIKIELLGDANGATTATVGGATAGGVIPKSEVIHHVEADRARVLAVLE
jgi:tripartite-type tricarboxylate transporter receptor subunit TctC